MEVRSDYDFSVVEASKEAGAVKLLERNIKEKTGKM